jgi:hypothetical protein
MTPVELELEQELEAIRTMMPERRKQFVERFGRPRNMSDVEYIAWVMEDPS